MIKHGLNKLLGRGKARPPKRRADVEDGLNTKPDLTGRFCPQPFTQFDVSNSGNVYACCSNWLPTPYGNVNQEEVADIWNSPTAEATRAAIHDGSYRYCDERYCPRIQAGDLPTKAEAKERWPQLARIIDEELTQIDSLPEHVNLCSDRSCNLTCPSCRMDKIMLTKGPHYEKQKALNDKIVNAFLGEPHDRTMSINVTGSGDPFGSKIYRKFLFGLDGADYPNVFIDLQTNGVMFTPTTWSRMAKIHNNIRNIYVSFDAAEPDTYAITRRGGDWQTLLENCRFLGDRRAEGAFDFFRVDFVVQLDNFREMGDFVTLGRSLGADIIHFSMVTDRNTWPEAEYQQKAIWKQTHPDFADFMETLQDERLAGDDVYLGNLTAYRNTATVAAE